jgi:putative restriction endonuclease
MDTERDRLLRGAAFAQLERLLMTHGDELPWRVLREGFVFEDRVVPLIAQQGIFKPAAMEVPLSITTSPRSPYDDEVSDDGFLRYRYRGTDPQHPDNVGLRRAWQLGLPLVYFAGITVGVYQAFWPVFIHADDPATLTFTVAFDEPQLLRPDLTPMVVDEARRAYVTRLAVQRLHQAKFRRRVIAAYRTSCAVCRLRHGELLDAAHILPDRDPRSLPVVPNGLSLCKIHHAAFDRNILGVRPDHVIEVRADVLAEVDGPMLEHGLQGHHGGHLIAPRRAADRPNEEFLEERYELFREAS